jgi:SOS-response transcriptional repressor LexA
VQRKHVFKVDWSRAVMKAMACNEHLKSQTALAKQSGVAQSTIGRILRREVDPQVANIERIAEAFGMSLAELAEVGLGGEPSTGGAHVALISWSEAGSLADAVDIPAPGQAGEWMPRPKRSGARTFALRVRGESMEPGYQHGDIIFVDPDVAPEHGKDVVVRLDDRDEAVFRRLVVEVTLAYLKPANPNWPDKINAMSAYLGARIIGVVIGKWVEK